MPEGHVAHRLANNLSKTFGSRIVQVSSPQGRFATEAAELRGKRFCEAESVGKHLFLRFDAQPESLVHIHLGLIGSLRIGKPGETLFPTGNQSTTRLRIQTDAAIAELRGPQWCRLVDEDVLTAVCTDLGPDPLRSDADPQRAWDRMRKTQRSIGAVLMDQRVFAGVGNIFRAEVLFRARIHPERVASQLHRREFDEVWNDLVGLMSDALVTGRIDTIDESHSPTAMGREPRQDRHGGEVYVYRRENQPCFVCGRPIHAAQRDGRKVYWCERCQRR